MAGVLGARIFILTCMCDAASGLPPNDTTESLTIDFDRSPLVFKYGIVAGYAIYFLLVFTCPLYVYRGAYLFFHNGGMIPVMLLMLIGGSLGRGERPAG